MKKYVLFDLDGTLTDPMEGITRSVQHALRHYGIEVTDRKQLTPFIGPPLKDSFMEFYGFDEKQAHEAIYVYREYFVPRGMFENEVYPGIAQMLAQLKQAGATLLVATSKPEDFAKQILEHFDLMPYFAFVGGSDQWEQRVNKSDVLRYIMEECHLTDMSELVMVGDRKFDVLGAKEFDIESVGVLYGYGSLQELQEAGADVIVKDVQELTQYLLQVVR